MSDGARTVDQGTPYLSVIVPAHNGAGVLPESLAALVANDLPRARWELVVVDDASTDATAGVAGEYADRVISLGGRPRGPAYARNRGVQASRGEVVVFVDADVCLHADGLRKIAETFTAEPALAALFGSYDAHPRAPGLVSRFRNLLHHHVHQSGAGEAETFWAGCGAVRRQVLIDVGLMDAWHYARPQIEDIELGRRLRRHGHRILLRPDIQGTHLKRWTLASMLRTDFFDRGIPWMRLLLREGAGGAPASLNLKPAEQACTALTGLAALALVAGAVTGSVLLLAVAGAAVLAVGVLNRRFYRLLARLEGGLFALAALPLHLLFYLTAGLAGLVGLVLHLGGRGRGPQPPAEQLLEAVEHREGAWPPPADRPSNGIWTTAGSRPGG